MLRGNLQDRVDPELVEIRRRVARALVVGFIDRDEQRLARLTELAGDCFVSADEPFAAVGDHHDEIGALDGSFTLPGNQIVERILAGAVHPSRIEELERRALPLHRPLERIAGGSGQRRHDRAARAVLAHRVNRTYARCGLTTAVCRTCRDDVLAGRQAEDAEGAAIVSRESGDARFDVLQLARSTVEMAH